MSCTQTPDCTCGCCRGTSVETPQVIDNLPGQPAITYRAGTWATFKESMLARLSSADYPALASLRTRESDDFTIALLDASSLMFDILTFYQERLANESFLRTAGQLRSLIELGRLVGYQPAPGVAASTYLAFTLKTAPGQPSDPSNPTITIPAGTQVQSVPPQGQQPQTFETAADIQAKSDWNALPVEIGIPWAPQRGYTSVYLDGTATQLQPGDPILIVGDERRNPKTAEDWWRWDIRIVIKVEADTANNRTRIAWNEGLGAPYSDVPPAQVNPKVYALRQRAALFGYNAIDPNMLQRKVAANLAAIGKLTNEGTATHPSYVWSNLDPGTVIDLDAVYPKVVQGSWVALVLPDGFDPVRSLSGYVDLYQVTSVLTVSRADFAQSAKITRIAPDLTSDLGEFSTNSSSALVQSELLLTAIQPLNYPLYANVVDLQDVRLDLVGVQEVALFGKAQKIAVAEGVNGLNFIPDDGSDQRPLQQGDILTITSPSALPPNPLQDPAIWSDVSTTYTLSVLDPKGRPGSVTAALGNFVLVPTVKDDPEVSESATVDSISTALDPFPHTQIVLKGNLSYCYERATSTVNANVALATHGSSVTEVMGSGSASTPNQSFALKQKPLTFVQAPTPTGRQSTLTVRASGVQWKEALPSLFEQPPTARAFATLNLPGGDTTVQFGDGVEGATLPTDQNNVQAQYRIGSGSAGNVAAGALTTLMDRPLGVGGVTNPAPATGGQDAATVADLRTSAPQTVLTLGRAVSIADYQNFAATFAGIAKAYVLWIPAGPGQGVFLTVAGVGGAALPSGNPTLNNLITALGDYGSPLVPVHVESFLETLFGFSADLAYDPAYDPKTVEAQVRQTLATTYSFANRTFGQGVSADGLAAVIQGVPGALAVNVKEIHLVATSAAGDLASQPGGLTVTRMNAWLAQQVTLTRPISGSPERVCAFLPVPSLTAKPQPAEILVLHPDPTQVKLGAMA
jgi:hypothetical protein